MRAGRLPLLVGCALAALAPGCSHYEWGAGAKLQFATLYVEPVRNRTLLPQAQAPIETQLRTTFLEDGRVQIVDSPSDADAVLQVVVTGYKRDVAATREQDAGLASKFSITLTTQCSLIDTHTGRAYFEGRVITAKTDVFTDNGNPHSSLVGNQLQAEYNNVPILAEAIANHIAHNVLDVW